MDKGVTSPLYGNYRAKVITNKDKEKFGRVLVYIPDVMVGIDDTKGIWARPANNSIGGRNTQFESDNHYMGSCMIPRIGAWLWIFFEAGNVNRPYYFAGLDIEHAKVLPENQVGENYQDKWTIFKSHEGRCIIISDDPDDARVEITGKKRLLKTPPSGDTASVYKIDDNQTTILLDERDGKEKLLIRTYKGDYINFDIENSTLQIELESDFILKTKGKITIYAEEDIDIKSHVGNVNIQAESGEMDIKSGDAMRQSSGDEINLKAQNDLNYQGGANINGLAGINMSHDAGGFLNEQSGTTKTATEAGNAAAASPQGKRG